MAIPKALRDREQDKFVETINSKSAELSVAHGLDISGNYLPLKVVDDGNNLGKIVVVLG